MIKAIKLEDGSSVDIAPSKSTFNIYINTLGDIISFTIKDTEESKALWAAAVEYHKSFGKDKENSPAQAKAKKGGGVVFIGADGDQSLAMIKVLRKNLRLAAPQYTNAITFLIKRYESIRVPAKAVKLQGHHYNMFAFSIAKGCKAF